MEHLRKNNATTINLRNQSAEDTIASMAKGIDVIVQARLQDGLWMGYADILLKS